MRPQMPRMAIGLAALVLSHPAWADPPVYRVTVVGEAIDAPGGTVPYPLGLNLNGRVVGYTEDASGAAPLNWKDGVYRPMSSPPLDWVFASAVNNLGRVVGAGYRLDTSGRIVEGHALKWTGGVAADLGSFGGHLSVATSINNFGDQIVGFSSLPGETQVRAFRYYSGALHTFNTLPGATQSYPYDISDNGYIVGAAVAGGPARPFRFRNFGVEALSLPAGVRTGAANAVNNIGAAVGTYEIDLATGSFAAVLWRVSGQRVELGNLGGSTAYAAAHDINNLGQIVGTSLAPDGMAAFLWQGGHLYDLRSLVSPEFAGIRLISAGAINDSSLIAASALIDGRPVTVLLTPVTGLVPAPGAWAILGLAGLLAARRRR